MSLTDAIVLVVVVLALGISVLLSLVAIEAFESNPTFNATISEHSDALEKGKTAILLFDKLMVVLLAGILAAGLISAFLVKTHPVFLVGGILFNLLMVAISSVISNIWFEIASHSLLAAIANNLPSFTFFFRFLPTIVFVMWCAIAIVMYGRGSVHSAAGGGV